MAYENVDPLCLLQLKSSEASCEYPHKLKVSKPHELGNAGNAMNTANVLFDGTAKDKRKKKKKEKKNQQWIFFK